MKVKVCEWDSLFFNKKIGEIEFESINQSFAGLNEFDLIYSKQNEEAIVVIDDFEHTYTETRVIFSKNIENSNNPVNSAITSALNIDINIDQIYKLAFESGKFSRFKLDSKFSQDEFEQLYKIWIDNSLAKKIAEDVLIYKERNTVLGLITYKISDHYATIGLLATDPEMQGKGIGTILVKAVEDRLTNVRINELRIPTQLQNERGCSFYTNLGYTIKEKIIIKHYWKK